MNVRSLARQTDFIFAGFAGAVIDRGSYEVVRTPDNPNRSAIGEARSIIL
jgi:hypothetical protein